MQICEGGGYYPLALSCVCSRLYGTGVVILVTLNNTKSEPWCHKGESEICRAIVTSVVRKGGRFGRLERSLGPRRRELAGNSAATGQLDVSIGSSPEKPDSVKVVKTHNYKKTQHNKFTRKSTKASCSYTNSFVTAMISVPEVKSHPRFPISQGCCHHYIPDLTCDPYPASLGKSFDQQAPRIPGKLRYPSHSKSHVRCWCISFGWQPW